MRRMNRVKILRELGISNTERSVNKWIAEQPPTTQVRDVRVKYMGQSIDCHCIATITYSSTIKYDEDN